VIWPCAQLPLVSEEIAAPAASLDVDAEAHAHADAPSVAPVVTTAFGNLPANRLKLLRGLPVSIIVRLAEKKIEMGQLLALSPGAMITFNKSCEDLLDLYVNNHLYCRGEAVKIGEKFGLKINQVGVVPVRDKSVLQG
jgi:flagellar motor switch protein FliN/FliY